MLLYGLGVRMNGTGAHALMRLVGGLELLSQLLLAEEVGIISHEGLITLAKVGQFRLALFAAIVRVGH